MGLAARLIAEPATGGIRRELIIASIAGVSKAPIRNGTTLHVPAYKVVLTVRKLIAVLPRPVHTTPYTLGIGMLTILATFPLHRALITDTLIFAGAIHLIQTLGKHDTVDLLKRVLVTPRTSRPVPNVTERPFHPIRILLKEEPVNQPTKIAQGLLILAELIEQARLHAVIRLVTAFAATMTLPRPRPLGDVGLSGGHWQLASAQQDG